VPVAVGRSGLSGSRIDGTPGGSWLDCQAGWRSGTEGDEASDDAGSKTHSVERVWKGQSLMLGCVEEVSLGMDA
jgi:hypothetical protein